MAISALLCACGPDSALEIVVEMDPAIAVDKVQLYVGLGSPQNSQGSAELLVPRDYVYPDQPAGFYWKRDRNGVADVADVERGAADVRFVFHEGSHDRMTVIVVGYQAGAIVAATALENAYLASGSVRQYHVKLAPASAAFPRPARARAVHLWGPGPADTQCAYLEDATKPGHGIYVVEHDDRDCDGHVEDDDPQNTLECRPEVYNGARRPEPERTVCLALDKLPKQTDGMACVLGGPGCVDGRGMQACHPSTVCTQPLYCLGCADSSDPFDCMATRPAATPNATHIECLFFVELGAGPAALCPEPAVLSPSVPTTLSCDPARPFAFWSMETRTWNPGTLPALPLAFTAAKPTASCNLALAASGTLPNIATPAPLRSLVMLPFANGRTAALPLSIKFAETTDCSDSSSRNVCSEVGEDISTSLATCLTSPVVEPW